MLEDPDPITAMGLEHGCMYCNSKTDNFYFLEYVNGRVKTSQQCAG